MGSETGYIDLNHLDLNHLSEFRVTETRACQICGKGTRSRDFMLCDKCLEALRKMIYGGEDGKIN